MRPTRLLYRIHRWTGLTSGLFVLFFSITGALAVYRAEIDRWTTPGLALEPAGTRAPLQAALDAARAVAPERAPELMWLPARLDEAIVVRLAPGVDLFRVFVDPATARVTGTAAGENAANVIRQVHLRFYFFGWQGRVVTGLFGVMLLISAITGAIIYAPFMKGVWQSGRRWWQLRETRQLRWSDVHKLIGITALIFNVIIGATGAVLGLENLQRFSPALGDALHPGPSGSYALASCPSPLALDRVVEGAEAHMRGLTASLVSFPVGRQKHVTVSGNLPGRLRAAGASWVTLDPCTGRVLESFDARAAAPVASAYLWMEPLHFGDWGGWALKLAYCVLGITSGVLAVSGIGLAAMKWRHRRL